MGKILLSFVIKFTESEQKIQWDEFPQTDWDPKDYPDDYRTFRFQVPLTFVECKSPQVDVYN